ncbi:MAG: hypothetical protein ABI780_01890 [Ardenticatenales bacterium]
MMTPPSAVLFDDLPIDERARYLRRVDPGRAVAYDLVRQDGQPCARMFFTAGRIAGIDALDPETRAVLYQWAAMIAEDMAPARRAVKS